LGLAAIVVAGFCAGKAAPHPQPTPVALSLDSLGFVMILIFYAYSGWNEMAYVGSEVRDPQKNIFRALMFGTVAVGVLYILLNVAFVYTLGLEGLRHSEAVAADMLRLTVGDWASRLISVLICISALGAINGMIFTGSRIYYAMGTDHRLYAWLGQWSASRDTPIRSLLIQAVVTIALTIGFGLTEKGFQNSVIFTAPPFWIFLLLVGLSLFVLRRREPEQPRPYRVPLYPVVPIVFCLSNLFMSYKSLTYAAHQQPYWVLASAAILLVGLLLSFLEPAEKPSRP
jgi:basic amino acid/polyamine antiporter, APA family